jgi:hypothetical protein
MVRINRSLRLPFASFLREWIGDWEGERRGRGVVSRELVG